MKGMTMRKRFHSSGFGIYSLLILLSLEFATGWTVADDRPRQTAATEPSRLAIPEVASPATQPQEGKIDLLRKRAEQGVAEAQAELGARYQLGDGVTKDYAAAVMWYRKAAEQGHAAAQNSLGVLFQSGWGVAQDNTEAARWYRKAADQGWADAQFNLGLIYFTGRGVPQSNESAVKLWRAAAEQGLAEAELNLGKLHAMGRGVPKDNVNAYMWLSLAEHHGDPNAAEGLKYLRQQMSAKQIAEAKQRAQERISKLAEKAKPATQPGTH
jgi:TPR repeat protein